MRLHLNHFAIFKDVSFLIARLLYLFSGGYYALTHVSCGDRLKSSPPLCWNSLKRSSSAAAGGGDGGGGGGAAAALH